MIFRYLPCTKFKITAIQDKAMILRRKNSHWICLFVSFDPAGVEGAASLFRLQYFFSLCVLRHLPPPPPPQRALRHAPIFIVYQIQTGKRIENLAIDRPLTNPAWLLDESCLPPTLGQSLLEMIFLRLTKIFSFIDSILFPVNTS